MQQVEGVAGILTCAQLRQRQARSCDNRQQSNEPGLAHAPAEHQHQRKKQVVLLFHGERPGVQQRFEFRRCIEIVAFQPEQQVG